MKYIFSNNNIICCLGYVLLFLFSYYSIFYNLGSDHIKMWDEATYANNAIDMLLNGNWITVMHEGEPDLYNTKPPLVIWLQALSMSIFGINEFSIRFPSAVFGFMTTLLIYIFSLKVLKSRFIGFSAVLILLSSSGYIGNHVVRTGDLDSSLVFWLTLYSLIFLSTVLNKRYQTNLSYFIISLGICCAFLSKGIAGFLFLPSLFIISFLYNNQILYTHRRLYYSILATITICCSYYYFRELDNPGYFKIVWENEILRINNIVMEWQVKPFNYYFNNLIEDRFYPYFILLPLSIVTILFQNRNSNYYQSLIYLWIIAVGYFLIVSYPPVKLEWYDAPLFPILSLIVAISLSSVIKLFKSKSTFFKPILVLVLLCYTTSKVISNNKPSENVYVMERDGAFLKQVVIELSDIKKITVYKKENHTEHYDQVLFYKRAFYIEKKTEIEIKQTPDFNIGEFVLVCKEELQTLLVESYTTEVVHENDIGTLYKILDQKTIS